MKKLCTEKWSLKILGGVGVKGCERLTRGVSVEVFQWGGRAHKHHACKDCGVLIGPPSQNHSGLCRGCMLKERFRKKKMKEHGEI